MGGGASWKHLGGLCKPAPCTLWLDEGHNNLCRREHTSICQETCNCHCSTKNKWAAVDCKGLDVFPWLWDALAGVQLVGRQLCYLEPLGALLPLHTRQSCGRSRNSACRGWSLSPADWPRKLGAGRHQCSSKGMTGLLGSSETPRRR